MKFKKRDGWMLAGGFALGTLGLKALSSSTAKKCYVQGVAKGLQAKAAYQDVVEPRWTTSLPRPAISTSPQRPSRSRPTANSAKTSL